MIFLISLLIAPLCAEVAVGFGQETAQPWYCWWAHCDKVDNPDSGKSHWEVVHSGNGKGGTETVGECLVAECVAEGWSLMECEDPKGWGCLPFTTEAKKCDPKDGCEKWTKEWMGDGICDFEKCGNCHAYWVNGVF